MNQVKFAEFVGVSPQRVSQWVAEGMAGVTWHGGRGKGTFIEAGKALAWLEQKGYGQSPDMRRDGDGFSSLQRASSSVSSVRAAESQRAARDAIDGIWDGLSEASDNIVEYYDVDPAEARHIAIEVLIAATGAACTRAGIKYAIPEAIKFELEGAGNSNEQE